MLFIKCTLPDNHRFYPKSTRSETAFMFRLISIHLKEVKRKVTQHPQKHPQKLGHFVTLSFFNRYIKSRKKPPSFFLSLAICHLFHFHQDNPIDTEKLLRFSLFFFVSFFFSSLFYLFRIFFYTLVIFVGILDFFALTGIHLLSISVRCMQVGPFFVIFWFRMFSFSCCPN